MPSPAAVKPEFGQWLNYVRRSHGLSQEDLATRIGVGERTIRAWEAGHIRPSGRSLRRVAAATNTVVVDLLALERVEVPGMRRAAPQDTRQPVSR